MKQIKVKQSNIHKGIVRVKKHEWISGLEYLLRLNNNVFDEREIKWVLKLYNNVSPNIDNVYVEIQVVQNLNFLYKKIKRGYNER